MTDFAEQLARAQMMAQQHGSLIYVPSPQCECLCHRIRPATDWRGRSPLQDIQEELEKMFPLMEVNCVSKRVAVVNHPLLHYSNATP